MRRLSGDEQRLASILDAHTGAQLVAGLKNVEVIESYRGDRGWTHLRCLLDHDSSPHWPMPRIIPVRRRQGHEVTLPEMLLAIFAHHLEHHADRPFE